MAQIHFDITGDNSNLVSTINDTTSHLEDLAGLMKDLSNAGLDTSNTEAQLKSLESVIQDNESVIESYRTQLEALAQAQQDAANAGDATAVADYGQQMAEVGGKMQEVIDDTNRLKAAHDELAGSIKQNNGIMEQFLGGQQQYAQLLQMLPAPIQGVIKGINGITSAAMKFIMTPIGAVVAALALAFKALYTWLNKTAEGQQKLAKITGYFKGLMAGLEQIAKNIGKTLFNAFKNPKEAAKDFLNFLKSQVVNRIQALARMFTGLGDIIKKVFSGDWSGAKEAGKQFGKDQLMFLTGIDADKAKEHIKNLNDIAKAESALNARRQKLHIDRTNWEAEEAELDEQIAEARNNMWTGSTEERTKAAQKAEELINKKFEQRIKFAKEEYAIKKASNALTENSQEDLDEEARLLAEITRQETARQTALVMFKRRGNMAEETTISYEKNLQDELTAMALQNEDKRIALMRNEGEKTAKQIQQNYDKQMETLRKTRYKWEQANRKEKGEAKLTPEQEAVIKEAEELAAQERDRALEDALKNDYQKFTDYLKEFESFEVKRLAIAEEYGKKIKEAEEAGDYYTAESLRKKENREYSALETQKMLRNANLGMVFSNLGLVLTAPLQATVDELRRYTQTKEFRESSAEDQKAIYEAIAKAADKLTDLGGLNFTKVGDAVSEYNQALTRREDAEYRLGKAAERLTEAEKKLGEVRGKDATSEKYWSKQVEERRAEMEYRETRFQETESEVIRTQAEATQALTEFNSAVKRVDSSIRQLYRGELAGLWNLLGPEFTNSLGLWITGGKEVVKETEVMAKKLQEQGRSLASFSSDIASIFTSEDFSMEEKVSAALGQIKGIGGNKIGDAVQEFVAEAVENGTDAKAIGEGVKDLIKNAGENASAAAGVWGMVISLFLNLMDEFKEHGIGDFIKTLLTNIGEALEGILSHLIEDLMTDIVEGIINFFEGTLKGFINLLTVGAFKDEIAKWWKGGGLTDEEIKDLTQSNESLEQAINSLKDAINKVDATAVESREAYEKAVQAEEQIRTNLLTLINSQAYVQKGKGQGNAGGLINRLPDYAWAEIEKTLGRALPNRVFDLLEMTPEEWKKIATELPGIYDAILKASEESYSDISGYIEDMVARAGKLQEYKDSLSEKLTGVSWDSFLDSFKSLLKDMDSEAQDFADNFEEMMSDAILDSLVNERYRDAIRALYDQFVEFRGAGSAGGTDLTAEEKEILRAGQEAIASGILTDRNALIDAGLIKKKSSEDKQGGGSSAFQALNQETGNELNGRAAALQISSAMIQDSAQKGLIQLNALTTLVTAGNAELSRIYEQHNVIITSLQTIEGYTKTMKDFGATLNQIQENTSRI